MTSAYACAYALIGLIAAYVVFWEMVLQDDPRDWQVCMVGTWMALLVGTAWPLFLAIAMFCGVFFLCHRLLFSIIDRRRFRD